MPVELERESTIVLAAKFTYDFDTHELKLEFDPHPQLASTNMLIRLRDRVEELLAERAEPIELLKEPIRYLPPYKF